LPIFELDPYREIVAVHVERDLDFLRVREGPGRIVKAPDSPAEVSGAD
jgi:hypothetical protein